MLYFENCCYTWYEIEWLDIYIINILSLDYQSLYFIDKGKYQQPTKCDSFFSFVFFMMARRNVRCVMKIHFLRLHFRINLWQLVKFDYLCSWMHLYFVQNFLRYWYNDNFGAVLFWFNANGYSKKITLKCISAQASMKHEWYRVIEWTWWNMTRTSDQIIHKLVNSAHFSYD